MTSVFVPVFDGNHYECWSVKMKTLLKAMDLWDVVETGVQQEPSEEISSTTSPEFEGESYESSSSSAEYNSACWKQWMEMKDATALHITQNGLTFEIFPWIASATSSKKAWELLLVKSLGGPMFQAKKLIDLKKEYANMKMTDAETIHEFTGKLMELVFRMKSCGWEVEDKEVVKKIISSLPPRFDQVLVKVAERLSIRDLIDYLLVHEYSTKPVQESLEESVTESVDVESLPEEHETLNSLREKLNTSIERVNSSIETVNSLRKRLNSLRERSDSSNEVIPVQVALTEIRRVGLYSYGFVMVFVLVWVLCCVFFGSDLLWM